MLALISDLHFCDGTAIPGNVAPETFALSLREIYDLALEIAEARNKATHVDLVLLGDIIDLLRTERWFEDRSGNPVPLAERPWGSVEALEPGPLSPAVSARARSILAEILSVNEEALSVIRGESVAPPPGVEVRRIYIPGNHDRLSLLDDGIRRRILDALDAIGGPGHEAEGIFTHHLEMPAYGIIARHGHEWDVWNFPGYRDLVPSEYKDEDYLPTPIGDPITTEMAAALPYEMAGRLATERVFSPEQVLHIHERMKRIQDVRPLLTSFRWAYATVENLGHQLGEPRARVLRDTLDDTLRVLARRFRRLEFYQEWFERNHAPLSLDAPLALGAILGALSCEAFPTRPVASLMERALVWRHPTDAARRGALRESLRTVGKREMRFVVYGHTHSPDHVALHGGPITQDVYLNTGTYRPGVFRADDGVGFVGWQRLAYTCIASEEEVRGAAATFGGHNVGPAFVAWTGGRSAGAPTRTSAPFVR